MCPRFEIILFSGKCNGFFLFPVGDWFLGGYEISKVSRDTAAKERLQGGMDVVWAYLSVEHGGCSSSYVVVVSSSSSSSSSSNCSKYILKLFLLHNFTSHIIL